jgi:hypothetical protein
MFSFEITSVRVHNQLRNAMLTPPPPAGSGSGTIHTMAICIIIGAPILTLIMIPQFRAIIARFLRRDEVKAPTASDEPGATAPGGVGSEMVDYSIYDEEPSEAESPVGGSP